MKRSLMMIGAVIVLALAGAAVAAPVDVTHTMAVASVAASPAELGASVLLASVVLGVPVAETADQAVEVATPSAPTMRAKFQVASIEQFQGAEKVKFGAVCKSGGYPDDGLDEDNTYAKWSPSATCEIMITNPALHGQFKPEQKFYVDFTPAT